MYRRSTVAVSRIFGQDASSSAALSVRLSVMLSYLFARMGEKVLVGLEPVPPFSQVTAIVSREVLRNIGKRSNVSEANVELTDTAMDLCVSDFGLVR